MVAATVGCISVLLSLIRPSAWGAAPPPDPEGLIASPRVSTSTTLPAAPADAELSVGPCVRRGGDRREPSPGRVGNGSTPLAAPVPVDFLRRELAIYLSSTDAIRPLILTSGDGANPARIWDAINGSVIATLDNSESYWGIDPPPTHFSEIFRYAAFSADGTRVAMISDDPSPAVWTTNGGQRVATLAGSDVVPRTASMNDNGTRVVIGGPRRGDAFSQQATFLWDLSTGTHSVIVERPDIIGPIRLNAAGTTLIFETHPVRFGAATLGVWDQGGNSLTIEHFNNTYPAALAFRNDLPFAATPRRQEGKGLAVDLWDIRKPEPYATIWVRNASEVQLSLDARYLVASRIEHDGGVVRTVWDIVSTREMSEFRISVGSRPPARSGLEGFSADGKRYAALDTSGSMRQWNLFTGNELVAYSGEANWLAFAIPGLDGQWVATWPRAESGVVRDIATDAVISRLIGLKGPVRSAEFSDDSKRLIARDKSGTVVVWDAVTGRVLFSADSSPVVERAVPAPEPLPGIRIRIDGGAPFAALSPNGALVAKVDQTGGGSLVVTEIDSERRIFRWDLPAPALGDGAGVPVGPPISRREALDGISRSLKTVATAVTFSADSAHVGILMGDGTAFVLDTAGGAPTHRFDLSTIPAAAQRGVIPPVARMTDRAIILFSRDGRRLLTSDYFGRIIIWNAETGAYLRDLIIPIDYLEHSVTLSPDGARLAAFNGIWDTETGARIGTLRTRRPTSILGAIGWTRDGQNIVVTCDVSEMPG